MNIPPNPRFACGRIARRTFLADIGMGFTGLALGSMLHRDTVASASHIRAPGSHFTPRAKNVIWINPESPGAWGFGDSVMDKYLPYTDIAEECRNLKQLTRLVDRLVL